MINLQQYFHRLKEPNSNKLGFRVGKCVLHRFPKRSFIHLFCLSDLRNGYAPRFAPTSSIKKSQTSDHSNSVISSQHQLVEHIDSRFVQSVRTPLEGFQQRKKEPQVSDFNALHFFWLNSSNQQKKRALIHLCRSAGRMDEGTAGFFFSMHPMFKRYAFASHLGIFRKKTNSDDFFLKKKDRFRNENVVQEISENKKKHGKKRYHFPFLVTESPFLSNFDTFPNKFFPVPVGSKGDLQDPQDSVKNRNFYVHFYLMYYSFLKNMNITTLGVAKTQKTIQFLSKCEANRNSLVLQIKQNRKKQLIKLPRVESQKSSADFEIQKKEKMESTQVTRNSFSTFHGFSNIQNVLSFATNTSISFRPLKIHSIFQSANLVAQEIACKLEQKKSFRLICRLIFQQLNSYSFIKGIRITCSGRMNGAEIAKTECRKCGETSLHVFSEKIDYAQAIASTPYGILGIKVWISFL